MSQFGSAGVVNTGFGSVPIANPTFSGSGLSPAILNLAKKMSRQGQEEANSFSASRGLSDSSFNNNALNRAWYQGLQGAIGTAQAEQQRIDRWSQTLLGLQSDAQDEGGDIGSQILQGAATGAVTGATIGSPTGPFTSGAGAVGGAIIGGLAPLVTDWLGGLF